MRLKKKEQLNYKYFLHRFCLEIFLFFLYCTFLQCNLTVRSQKKIFSHGCATNIGSGASVRLDKNFIKSFYSKNDLEVT